MQDVAGLLNDLTQSNRELFRECQSILSFQAFLDRLRRAPRRLVRNVPEYLCDTFDYFGSERRDDGDVVNFHFKLFEQGSDRSGPIIGGERTHTEIYRILKSFVRQGQASRLIMLHGPNGSAKSSTVEAIGHAMQRYSETDEGAVYRFNWIFPTQRSASARMKGESSPIGFSTGDDSDGAAGDSYALLDESQIACRIPCEFKDNPIYLIPQPDREALLRGWIAAAENIPEAQVEIPPHALISGLSKRNQLILENLMVAYEGDFAQVMRHVQVERFYYSRQYRVGVSTVEPQMSIDAQERQLTMDKNIQNLPVILHNIRFHEAFGELVEANRGILEFSDMLKRPIDAFKYLLSTVEKGTVNLPSSTANLDVVFFATTNDKYLDAFKSTADFSSFRGRFELVTVPYLLRPSQETQIYSRDLDAIRKSTKVAPHSLELLALWAVMTRIKPAEPDHYESQHRAVVGRLEPRIKVKLYENQALRPDLSAADESVLKSLATKITTESRGMVFYEGRFRASPRELRMILHHAAQNPRFETVCPPAIFHELEVMIKDRTAYEFLQYEAQGRYHDCAYFLDCIKAEFAAVFAEEVMVSMTMIDSGQYQRLLQRYIEHVVATLKKEKIYNSKTGSYDLPSESVMQEVEKILGLTGSATGHREAMLGRIAAWKIDHPKAELDFPLIFTDELKQIQDHYHHERKAMVDANYKAMMAVGTADESSCPAKELKIAKATYAELERRFGYDESSTRQCLRFLLAWEAKK